jgi:hypothetical protein
VIPCARKRERFEGRPGVGASSERRLTVTKRERFGVGGLGVTPRERERGWRRSRVYGLKREDWGRVELGTGRVNTCLWSNLIFIFP